MAARVSPPHRHVRLELSRPGKGRGTASSTRRRGRDPGIRRARVLRRALRHGRGQLDLLRPAARRRRAQLGERTPAGFEFSVKLYQKFTHPEMFAERAARSLPDAARGDQRLLSALAAPNAADIDEFRRGIDPLASGGKLGALLAQFPASFKDAPAAREYLCGLLRAFARLSRRRRTAPPQLERRARRHARAAQRVQRGVGADRRTEIPVLDPPELPAERDGLLLHAAARPERCRSGGGTTSRRTATTTCIPRRSCRNSPTPPTRRAIS